MRLLILKGLPGSGKSTLARALSKRQCFLNEPGSTKCGKSTLARALSKQLG